MVKINVTYFVVYRTTCTRLQFQLQVVANGTRVTEFMVLIRMNDQYQGVIVKMPNYN